MQIAQTKHFEDSGSNDHTPTVERFQCTGCKPIFEALNFRFSGLILENESTAGADASVEMPKLHNIT